MEITYLGEHILQWHITHRCNLRCAHCYQSEYASEMSGEELFPALDKYERFLEEKHIHGHINLTGGEPLVHPDYFRLAREIRRRNMDLGILTNGTLIDREKAKLIAELRPLFVQVSLDGTRRIHNAVRGSGSFERAMRGIDWLKKEGVSVHVSFTAQRTNLNQLRPLARVCRVHKVDKLWFDRVVIPSDEDRSRLSLTTEEYKKLVETAGKLHARGLVSCSRALQFLGCEKSECYRCGAGENLLIFLADGGIMPCRRLPFVIGNIRDGELKDILENSETMQSLANAPVPKDCLSCRYSGKCRGGAKCVTYAQTGLLFAKDVNCWL
ncbi:MAG: radical SAM protein [Oscillospiraceae bacterium]|nr:radical SAM protein [Oscillospiraceae bacterium]